MKNIENYYVAVLIDFKVGSKELHFHKNRLHRLEKLHLYVETYRKLESVHSDLNVTYPLLYPNQWLYISSLVNVAEAKVCLNLINLKYLGCTFNKTIHN